MTNLAEFYESQRERIMEALKKTADPLSEDYIRGLSALGDISFRLLNEFTPERGRPMGTLAKDEEPEEPEPTTEPDTDDDPATEHPHYTKEYVRGRLSAARVDKGVDISEIFKAAGGYANLSAVPVDDYWKLMEALDKALEEKG